MSELNEQEKMLWETPGLPEGAYERIVYSETGGLQYVVKFSTLPEAREPIRETVYDLIRAKNARLKAAEKLAEALKDTTDALEAAFCHDSVDADTQLKEIKAGRWNGVRAHIELNAQLLTDWEASK